MVTQLWDKHLPGWRGLAGPHKPLSPEAKQALLELVKRFEEESTPINPVEPLPPDEIHQMTIQRKVFARKGKWKRFPPEVETTHT